MIQADQSKPWNSHANLVLLQHEPDGLVLVNRRQARAAALGVGRKAAQLVGQSEVIHHQAAWLIPEDTIDARDGLHQPVPTHGLVDVHGVQAGRVEAGQPHVADDDHWKPVVGSLKRWPALRGALCCGCAAASPAGPRPSRS